MWNSETSGVSVYNSSVGVLRCFKVKNCCIKCWNSKEKKRKKKEREEKTSVESCQMKKKHKLQIKERMNSGKESIVGWW